MIDPTVLLHTLVTDLLHAVAFGLGGSKEKGKMKKVEKVVVVERKQKPAKASKQKRQASSQQQPLFTLLSADPFNPSFEGARIPDGYAFPTIPCKGKHTVSIVNPTGNNTSLTSVIRFDPYATYIDAQSLNGGMSTLSSTTLSSYTNNSSILSVIPYTAYNSNTYPFSAGRLVAAGAVVRLQTAPLNATGKFYFAPFPLISKDFGPGLMENVTFGNTANALNTLFGGYTLQNVTQSAILNFPGSFSMTAAELLQSPVVLRNKFTSPEFMKMRAFARSTVINNTTNFSTSTTTASGIDVAANAQDAPDMFDWGAGAIGWVIYGEALPVSTTVAIPLLEIEIVLHLEGTPLRVAATGLAPDAPLLPEPFLGVDGIMKSMSNMAWEAMGTPEANVIGNLARAGVNAGMRAGVRVAANYMMGGGGTRAIVSR